jgi:hypothetical protein
VSEAIEQIRASLRVASEALARRDGPTRTPKQREDDLEEARRAYTHASSILDALRAHSRSDPMLVETIAPLQLALSDLEIVLSEIHVEDDEHTERLPRVWQADG